MQKLTGVIPGDANIHQGHPGDTKTHRVAADNLSFIMRDQPRSQDLVIHTTPLQDPGTRFGPFQ